MEAISENPLPAVHELNRRQADGLTVVLWWVENTLSTYVEVEDAKDGQRFIIETPEDAKASDVFMHPFAFKAAEDRQNGTVEG